MPVDRSRLVAALLPLLQEDPLATYAQLAQRLRELPTPIRASRRILGQVIPHTPVLQRLRDNLALRRRAAKLGVPETQLLAMTRVGGIYCTGCRMFVADGASAVKPTQCHACYLAYQAEYRERRRAARALRRTSDAQQ